MADGAPRPPLSLEVLTEIVATQSAIGAAGLDFNAVLGLVVERTQRLTRGSGAVVELPSGDEMVYRAASGAMLPHLGFRLKIASSLSGRCVTTGEVLLCTDSEVDGRVDKEACRRVGVRSMVVVPLLVGSERVGVLKVMSPSADAFGEADVTILQIMAGFIGTAIHNADLFRQREAALSEIRRLAGEQEHLALTDGLTGLVNRRGGELALVREVARATRGSSSLSVIMIDIDHFKRVNDQHGHQVGDDVLRLVAGAIARTARASDVAIRWGGEEFVVVLPDTALVGARECAERVRVAVGALPLGGARPAVTVSVGAAEWSRGEDSLEVIGRADGRLYSAKAAGRDRVH